MDNVVPDWLAHRAEVLPGHDALIAGGRTIRYRELNQDVLGLVGALERHGVRPGDRVAVLASNSIELVQAIHAVPRLGAVLVLLNVRLTANELAWQLRKADVRLLLCNRDTVALALQAAAEACLAPPLTLPCPPSEPSKPADTHDLEDVHSIIFTSGTTGRPKGAMLTFGNFFASASASAFNLGVDPGDRWLASMPLFHVGGLSIVLRSAMYGTTIVLQGGFEEAEVNRALHEERVSHVSVVAAMLQRMLDADDRRSPPGLRVVLAGGGPVPEPLLRRALERGFPVIQTYGLTETASQVATLSPSEASARTGSAGKALLTTRLKVDAPPGEPGEILVAGPTVMAGYFRDSEATEKAIREGWLHTGDIGRLDEDGFLFVLDRSADLIITGGENVYPAEVEAALLAFPGIAEAAVVGLPDDRWGQCVAAAVVARHPVIATEVDSFLRDRIAGYKLPRRIDVVNTLPRTASGKVQRHLVREAMLVAALPPGLARSTT